MRFDRSSRMEHDSRARRTRARAHLERRRARRSRGSTRGARAGALDRILASPRALALGALLGSLAAGLLFGNSALGALLAAARGAPASVDRIAVRGAQRLAPQEIAAATGIAPGASASAVDVAAVVERLTAHAWIAHAEAVHLPGGALILQVVEREPLARIDLGTPPAAWAVDASGLPFAKTEPEALATLPLLRAASDIAPQQPNASLAEAIRIARRLPELGLATPSEVSIAAEGDPEGYALRLPEMGARFVVGRDDVDTRLDDLAKLLARRPALVFGAATVDLRFGDQAVLRMEPAPKGAEREISARGSASGSAQRNARSSGSARPTG